MLYIINFLNVYLNSLRKEEGQGMAEYGLILALVAIAAIAVLGFLGDELDIAFTSVRDALNTANSQ